MNAWFKKQFIAKTPSFSGLSETQQKELFKYAVLKKQNTITQRKTLTYSVPRIKMNTIETGDGPCYDQYQLDLESCDIDYQIALALCAGIGGATVSPPAFIACVGAATLIHDNCYNTAQDSYDLCRANNN